MGDELIEADSCLLFLAHWQSLQVENEVPHTRDFLDRSDPKLIPQAMILGALEKGRVIRFVGTRLIELWGMDQINTVFGESLQDEAMRALNANCPSVVTRPCGITELAEFMTPSGRLFLMETVLLPLAVDEGRLLRLCSFSQPMDELDDQDDKGHRYRGKRCVECVDVDSGVPLEPSLDTQ